MLRRLTAPQHCAVAERSLRRPPALCSSKVTATTYLVSCVLCVSLIDSHPLSHYQDGTKRKNYKTQNWVTETPTFNPGNSPSTGRFVVRSSSQLELDRRIKFPETSEAGLGLEWLGTYKGSAIVPIPTSLILILSLHPAPSATTAMKVGLHPHCSASHAHSFFVVDPHPGKP